MKQLVYALINNAKKSFTRNKLALLLGMYLEVGKLPEAINRYFIE